MMKKIVFVMLMLIFLNFLFATIVAQIGQYEIKLEDIQKEMKSLHDSLDVEIKYEIALNKVMETQILLQYAYKNNVYVDDAELEAFFVQQLGNHAKFQTNGKFDFKKFEEFQQTEKGKQILAKMEKSILRDKIKNLLEKSFTKTDEELFEQYFKDETKIDFGYAIVDVEDANIPPNASFIDAQKLFRENQNELGKTQKVKLEFVLLFETDFIDSVKTTVDEIILQTIEQDSTLSEAEITEMYNKLLFLSAEIFCENSANELRKIWQKTGKISVSTVKSGFLSEADEMNNLPVTIISTALNMEVGEISKVVKINGGMIFFKVVEKKEFKHQNRDEIANRFWKNYISKVDKIDLEYKKYFEENIEEFIVPTVTVQKIKIRVNALQEQIINEFLENTSNQQKISEITQKYHLHVENSLIYLDKFENYDKVDKYIAKLIGNDKYHGFIPSNDDYIYFQVTSHFSDYIPDYDKIKSQLSKLLETNPTNPTDSTDYFAFYEQHKKDFVTPDSMQIVGVKVVTDELEIEADIDSLIQLLEEDYNQNTSAYYRNDAVVFDYIFTKNNDNVKIIGDQISRKCDFEKYDFCFGTKIKIPKNEIIEYLKLPFEIKEKLLKMEIDQFSTPFAFDNGWIILHKIAEIPAGKISFDEFRFEKLKKTLNEMRREKAVLKIQTIFDSTRYLSHLRNYESFQTSFSNADAEFEYIGFLGEHKKELLRMWNGEKFKKIIKVDDGFAVIFLKKKKMSKQIGYEDALPKMRKMVEANKKYEQAKSFVSKIRDNLKKGANPYYQLQFLNGWHRIVGLKLTDKIPNVQFSDAILQDILKRQDGYFSPIFPIVENKMLFYHIYKIEQPTKIDFDEIKHDYRNFSLQHQYENWIEQQKALLGVTIYYKTD